MSTTTIGPSTEVDTAPASIGQRLLALMGHYRNQLGTLNCPILLRIEGPLDHRDLRAALQRIVDRHDALRTTFEGRGRRLRQHVRPTLDLGIQIIDLRPMNTPGREAQLLCQTEQQRPFDTTECCIRAALWQIADDEHVLCINMHHLVTDSWSCGVIYSELMAMLEHGPDTDLPEVALHYASFAREQQEAIDSGAWDTHRDYWVERLDGSQLAELPFAGTTTTMEDRSVAKATSVGVDIAPAVIEAMDQVAKRAKATLFSSMLGCFLLALHSESRQTDLTVASLFANRADPATRGAVGFFANMVCLRTRFNPAMSFTDLVMTTNGTVLSAFSHQHYPFQLLPPHLIQQVGRRADDVVFQMVADPMDRVRAGRIVVEPWVPESMGRGFELELSLVPKDGGLRAVLYFSADRITAEWAETFATRFAAIAGRAAAAPDLPIATLCADAAGPQATPNPNRSTP